MTDHSRSQCSQLDGQGHLGPCIPGGSLGQWSRMGEGEMVALVLSEAKF